MRLREPDRFSAPAMPQARKPLTPTPLKPKREGKLLESLLAEELARERPADGTPP
jgi:hypothetical protein